MRNLKVLGMILSAVLCWPTLSNAAVVFSNFGTPPQLYDTQNGTIVGNDFGGDNLAEGDTFTATATAVFGDLQIALSCRSACPGPFTVSLQSNSADAPASVLESFTPDVSSLGPMGDNNAPLLLTSVVPVTLTAGTQYWVTVTSDLNNSIAWQNNNTGDTSDQAISSDGGATYFSPSGLTPGAYQIDGVPSPVPLPGAAWLLASGLGGLGALSRRRRAV